jgi:hypothetical protein
VRIPRSVRDLQVEGDNLFWDFSSQRLFHRLDLFFVSEVNGGIPEDYAQSDRI